MKICFLGPADNYHIQKWCYWFKEHNYQVDIISYSKGQIDGCVVHYIDCGANIHGRDFQKLKYLSRIMDIKRIIANIQPDIINVHYASSYGTVAALARLPHYFLSVWGSDIYDFPRKSFLHKCMIKYSLRRADILFSTSKCMAKEVNKYTNKQVIITPFGVDCDLFSPNKLRLGSGCKEKTKNGVDYVVGTIKSLSDKYGIATLLEATAIFIQDHPEVPIRLRIAGKGPKEKEYKELAKKWNIDKIIDWLGFISQEQAAIEWANMDCAVIPSILESESFGVSAVEAQACATALIISDIPGLMEATRPGETSIVVKRSSPNQLAQAMYEMYFDSDRRRILGLNGRDFVCRTYELNKCFGHIDKLYAEYKIEKI